MDAPQQLDYAPPVAWHRRRSLQKWLIVIACLATLGSAYWWAPPAWRHGQMLYWQRQCMNYTANPDEVVWFDGGGQGNVPAVWRRFGSNDPINRITNGTAFLHQRRNPQGELRLVAVEILHSESRGENHPAQVSLWGRVIHPGGILHRPSDNSIRHIKDSHMYRSEFVIMAGQPDPDDPTHFTMECFIDGKRTVIDGWLMDDDAVLFEQRQEWTNPTEGP